MNTPLSPGWSQSTSFHSTLLEPNTGGSEPADLDPQRHLADSGRRLSFLSGDESIYFDADTRDHDSLATRGGQTLDLSSSYESMIGEPSEANEHKTLKPDRGSGTFRFPFFCPLNSRTNDS